MANDGELNFKTKIDDSDLDKGLKRVKSKVNNAAKDMGKGTKATNALKTAFNETGGAASSFTSKMGSLANSAGPVAAGLTVAVMAVKKFIEGLKAANEAFKVQEKAEKALQKAAENNPYLQKESVQRLKEFASGLQEISNYGDEGTIDIMAQLASTGRTEAEIMKIMGAAADYAAAKHIDLKTAAETLNSTYSGMAGTMGRQIAEIKDLTDEQLKNGDAIDLIAGKYKGFAKEAADSGTQAKNAFGDFMEAVGAMANPVFEKLNKKAKAFWEYMTDSVNNLKTLLDNESRKWGDIKVEVDEVMTRVNKTHIDKKTGKKTKGVSLEDKETLAWLKEELKLRKELNGSLTKKETIIYQMVRKELDARRCLEEIQKKEAEAAQAKANAEAKAAETAKKANEAADASNKKLKESLYALEVEAKAKGQAVSAQDRYNVYLNSYIDLLTKTNGLIKEGYPIEQKRLEQLREAEKAAKAAADTEEKLAAAIKLTQATKEALSNIQEKMRPAEHLQKELKALDDIKQKIKEATEEEIKQAQEGEKNILSREELLKGLAEAEKRIIDEKVNAIAGKEQSWWDKHVGKQADLLKMKQALADSEVLSEEEKYERMKQLDEAYLQSKAAQTAELLTLIQGYVNQSVSIMNQAANLMLETSKNQATAEQAQLEMKYLKGEMGEEEYNKKITESKRKAAREQYRIQMVQWTASILQATANIAEGVTKAIAQGGMLGLFTSGIVAAAGAVQIGSIIASKPIPPSFSTGGIVGGSSYSGDNIAANLNSREMVMNMSQQKGLWDFINGGSGGKGAAPNIVINNSASNIATAQPRLTRDKIEIMIDARVNESLKNGRYNDSLNLAQQGMSGDYYGI